jgi:hypothetical protein
MYGVTVSLSMLVEIRREAFRKRLWFKVLNRMDRAIVNLTIQCVTELKSKKLIEIVIELMDKLRASMKSKIDRLVETVGRPLAKKISEIAFSWGNTSAPEWTSDPRFPRYLAITDMNTPLNLQT